MPIIFGWMAGGLLGRALVSRVVLTFALWSGVAILGHRIGTENVSPMGGVVLSMLLPGALLTFALVRPAVSRIKIWLVEGMLVMIFAVQVWWGGKGRVPPDRRRLRALADGRRRPAPSRRRGLLGTAHAASVVGPPIRRATGGEKRAAPCVTGSVDRCARHSSPASSSAGHRQPPNRADRVSGLSLGPISSARGRSTSAATGPCRARHPSGSRRRTTERRSGSGDRSRSCGPHRGRRTCSPSPTTHGRPDRSGYPSADEARARGRAAWS